MRLAFLTGALAAGFVAAAMTTLVIWIVTVSLGSSEAWSIAPLVVTLAAGVFAAGTYVAERVAHRRTLARMRSIGEPWAFRED
jgi:hypothetical protein